MCSLCVYNILGLQNKMPDLLVQCHNVSRVALSNVLLPFDLWPKNCDWHFSLQLFLPSQTVSFHFHHVLLNSAEAGLCAVENITEYQNWDKLDGGHGKGAIMGDFAAATVGPEAIFTWHFIIRVQFLESWRWFLDLKIYVYVRQSPLNFLCSVLLDLT